MAFISREELQTRLPLDGEGISPAEIDEAIAAAVEYVVALTDDASGGSAVAQSAVAKLAHADLLDLIYPRDARARDSAAVVMRENAEYILSRYLTAAYNSDDDPTTLDSLVAFVDDAAF